MAEAPDRKTVDLSAYPDLVVIYLGMRVEEPRGIETLQALAPQIQATVDAQPDGLLLHERLIYSEDPPHTGMRQYWRDFDSLYVDVDPGVGMALFAPTESATGPMLGARARAEADRSEAGAST